jgi:hypothetical protein
LRRQNRNHEQTKMCKRSKHPCRLPYYFVSSSTAEAISRVWRLEIT